MEDDTKPRIGYSHPGHKKELGEPEHPLTQYIALALRIFERLEFERYPRIDPLTPTNSTLGCTPPNEELSK
jgi:hypothetical protein